tara:strand:- start:3460 stop:4422 length:963 start_codon:yes stop_codon:yes gene_type:complete
MQKILIIRLSSIGDIVLTSPIIRCLKSQLNSCIHYLVKDKYKIVIESNPYIDHIISVKRISEPIIKKLKLENYDLIIDLQNNFSSFILKLRLGIKSYTVNKKNWQKLLFIYCGLELLKGHVVDRYFACVNKMGVYDDNQGLDYFLASNIDFDYGLSLNQKFIVWSIGGSFINKQLSSAQIIEVCNVLNDTIVLLGGENEKKMGLDIVHKSNNKQIHNFCGKLTLNQSAYLIKKSHLVLTNDTGLMHIATAFKKSIISFWGCTKPKLGFSPNLMGYKCVEIVANPTHNPCSKHGNRCKLTRDGCVKQINSKLIIEAVKNHI